MHGIGSSHSENVELTEKQSQYLLRLHSKSSATLHAATKCILRSFFFFLGPNSVSLLLKKEEIWCTLRILSAHNWPNQRITCPSSFPRDT